MFRGVAGAGLSITLGLIAASAFAGTAAAAPAPKPGSSRSVVAGSSLLPNPVGKCKPGPQAKAQSGTPWAQQALDYPSLWKFTQGANVNVAVIDSGVDANPQFGNRVSVGPTLAKAPSGPAAGDCVGHGTMVAGIIAAAQAGGTAFEGVAPQASIESIKITNTEANISPSDIAAGISQAVQGGAQVINVSIDTPNNDPSLQTAVNHALAHNVVVVAAAGNDEQQNNPNGTTTTTHGPFYPADYPGVLSVGAVDRNGNLASYSDKLTHVSVTAPGENITSTFPGATGDSYAAEQGTSFAAPFVAGEAALIRSRYPSMSAQQVVQLIKETADGPAGVGTGNGLVNPVQAITAVLPSGAPGAPGAPGSAGAAPASVLKPAPVSVDRLVPHRSEKVVAASLAGGAIAVTVLVLVAAVVIPAGRRRGWRP